MVKNKILFISILLLVMLWGIITIAYKYNSDGVAYTSSELSVELKSAKQSGDLTEIELEFNNNYPGRIVFEQNVFSVITYDGDEINCMGTTLVNDNVPKGITEAKVRFKTDLEDVKWIKIKNKYIRIG